MLVQTKTLSSCSVPFFCSHKEPLVPYGSVIPVSRGCECLFNNPYTSSDDLDVTSVTMNSEGPSNASYQGYEVSELPPPSQAWATDEMLNILEICAPKARLQPRPVRSCIAPFLAPVAGGEEVGIQRLVRLQRRSEFRYRAAR